MGWSQIGCWDWDYFGQSQDQFIDDKMPGLGQSWEHLKIVSGPSQDSLRERLGIIWDHLGTDYSTILYVGLGQSQDRLRTGTGLGQDRKVKIEGIAYCQIQSGNPNCVAIDDGKNKH